MPHAVHDRYLIVDDDVWLLGSSVKDIGRGLCTVIKVDPVALLESRYTANHKDSYFYS